MAISRSLTDQLGELRELNLSIRKQLETVESRVPSINVQVSQLAAIHLIRDAALLGEIVYDRAYGPIPSHSDGGLLLQAALLVPEGLGLVAWDCEEFLSFREQGPGVRDARLRFVPFDELDGALKVLLLPQIEPLLARLILTAHSLLCKHNTPDCD